MASSSSLASSSSSASGTSHHPGRKKSSTRTTSPSSSRFRFSPSSSSKVSPTAEHAQEKHSPSPSPSPAQDHHPYDTYLPAPHIVAFSGKDACVSLDCTCKNNWKVVLKSGLPLIQHPLSKAMVDLWISGLEGWTASTSELPFDMVRSMYDPQLVNPIDPVLMDCYINSVADCCPRSVLFLNTTFYQKIASYCLCSGGKCKNKENHPLEEALKIAGHEGIRLFNHTRVWFPFEVRGHWLAIMLDRESKRNVLYDPCGLYRICPEAITIMVSDVTCILEREVEEGNPATETEFDKTPFDVITMDQPIDCRWGALLVLCSAEIFASMGLPDYIESAFLAFNCIAKMLTSGGGDDFDTALSKMFDAHDRRVNGAKEKDKAKGGNGAKAGGGKRSKNLKARIAYANNKLNQPAKVSQAHKPHSPIDATTESTSLPPASFKFDTGDAELDQLAQTLLDLTIEAKEAADKASSTASKTNKTNKAIPMTTNPIEKALLDRVVWMICMGVPPTTGRKEPSPQKSTMAAKKKAKGKGK